jgi:hypothetical protein
VSHGVIDHWIQIGISVADGEHGGRTDLKIQAMSKFAHYKIHGSRASGRALAIFSGKSSGDGGAPKSDIVSTQEIRTRQEDNSCCQLNHAIV